MFGILLPTKLDHGSIKSMACHSSCPELSECVSYTLHKLQMTDITLKAEQRSAMEAIYNRQDVFVWLPTGQGKSLCYQVLPFIMDYKHGVVETQRRSLALVVSPLVALMVDQHLTIALMSQDLPGPPLCVIFVIT